MIIKLYDIQEALTVRGSLEGARFKRHEDTDVSFESPVEYELTATKTEETVWFHGSVRAHLLLNCGRCLEDFAYSIESEIDIELMPKTAEPQTSEMELKTDEMDIYYFEGDAIDIDPYVFEEVMLNIPIKALCSDACKGMCPSCGKNLNLESCRCEKTGTGILGEKLRTLLKEQ